MATAAVQQPASVGPSSQPFSEEELDALISAALDCPCVKDLREGPCGKAFVAAFTCFHKSREVPKGYDCFDENVRFTDCLREHPEALASLKSAEQQGGPVLVPPGPPGGRIQPPKQHL